MCENLNLLVAGSNLRFEVAEFLMIRGLFLILFLHFVKLLLVVFAQVFAKRTFASV